MSDKEFDKGLDLSELFGMEDAFAGMEETTPEEELLDADVDLDGFLNSVARELTALSYLTMFNTLAMKEVIRLVTGIEVDENESILTTLQTLQGMPSGGSVTVEDSGNTAA